MTIDSNYMETKMVLTESPRQLLCFVKERLRFNETYEITDILVIRNELTLSYRIKISIKFERGQNVNTHFIIVDVPDKPEEMKIGRIVESLVNELGYYFERVR